MLTSVALCPQYALAYFYMPMIAPSVSSLQILVNICETELLNDDMSINQNKSVCIRLGPRFNAQCEHITSVIFRCLFCQW